MKTTSSFKMPKPTKIMLSNIMDPHLRGAIKRDFIAAIQIANIKPKSSREDRNKEKEIDSE